MSAENLLKKTEHGSTEKCFVRLLSHCSVFVSIRFLLVKTLPVHIAPFSNKYAMKTIGVHIAPVNRCCLIPFSKIKPFVNRSKKGANRNFGCHCNQQPINKGKECEAFSNVSVFGIHTENGSFSKRTVFKFMRFN